MSPAPVLPSYTLFIGIDVAAKTVTAIWTTAGATFTRPLTITQTPQGYTTLHERLQTTGHAPATTLVVMEATGSYWITLAMTLVGLGYAVSVINPKQAHNFAKALLKRAKTDPGDAQMLAQLAARLQPPRWTPPPAVDTELQQRLAHRNARVTLRTQVRNQLHALRHQPVVVASVQRCLEQLIEQRSPQIAEVEQELAAALQQDDAWATAAARLQSIPGIGLLAAVTILTTTINFSLCATADAAGRQCAWTRHHRTCWKQPVTARALSCIAQCHPLQSSD